MSWVTIEDNETLHLADSDFTLLAWVNFAEDVAGRPGRAIMGKDEGGGGNVKWIFRYWDEGVGEGRTLNWHINKPGPSIQINSKPWDADVNKWYQVGGVKDGREYTFYIDGKTHGQKEDDTDLESVSIMDEGVGADARYGSTSGCKRACPGRGSSLLSSRTAPERI